MLVRQSADSTKATSTSFSEKGLIRTHTSFTYEEEFVT